MKVWCCGEVPKVGERVRLGHLAEVEVYYGRVDKVTDETVAFGAPCLLLGVQGEDGKFRVWDIHLWKRYFADKGPDWAVEREIKDGE